MLGHTMGSRYVENVGGTGDSGSVAGCCWSRFVIKLCPSSRFYGYWYAFATHTPKRNDNYKKKTV